MLRWQQNFGDLSPRITKLESLLWSNHDTRGAFCCVKGSQLHQKGALAPRLLFALSLQSCFGRVDVKMSGGTFALLQKKRMAGQQMRELRVRTKY